MPDMICRWNIKTNMIKGRVTMTVAAESNRLALYPCSLPIPSKEAITTGIVQLFSLNNNDANKNSFHAAINTRMAVVNTPGIARGNITQKNPFPVL